MRGERVEWPIAKDNGELATGALACPMLGLFPSPFRLDNSRAGERKGGGELCILGDREHCVQINGQIAALLYGSGLRQ